MTNQSRNKHKIQWVWYSTHTSIVTRQVSVLAVFETLFVLVLYYWLACHFDYQWWLYLAAMAAPLILLRSKASTKRGLELLQGYVDKNKNDVSIWRRIVIVAVAVITSLTISYYLMDTWLIHYQYWELYWRSIVVGFVVIVIAGMVAGMNMDLGAIMDVVAGSGTITDTGVGTDDAIMVTSTITIAGLGAFGFAIVGLGEFVGAIVGAFTGAFAFSFVFVFMFALLFGYKRSDKLWLRVIALPFTVIVFLGIAIGYWLRSLFIRILATLQHPIIGLRQLPANLHEILWLLDLTHPPELLPNAKKINNFFSADGIIKEGRDKGFSMRIVTTLIAVAWYIPALLWRWSLKATLWLWWPIAFLLRSPLEAKNLDDVRDHAVRKVYGLGKWLPVLAIVVMAWLLLGYFPQLQTFIELLPDSAQSLLKQLNNHLTVPSLGLRQIMLWLCCGLILLVWYQAYNLAVLHKIILEDETSLEKLKEERKKQFRKRVEILEKWRTIQIVVFIFLGYSILLYLANQYYPDDVLHFVPAWLISYL